VEQQLLVLTYRDKVRYEDIAAVLDCSVRKIAYLLPAARRRLTDILDRLDLLRLGAFSCRPATFGARQRSLKGPHQNTRDVLMPDRLTAHTPCDTLPAHYR
jgi:hypothetical protein